MLEHVGKYEVKRLLGKGATGSVYLASDPFGQRDVALKVMDRLPEDPEEARRQLRFFQNEASLAGKLRHPHIVSILDAGVDDLSGADPVRYLVMELVEGAALTKYCEPRELLEPARVLEIAYKCCKALEFANQLGVVHRDIKPANILVDSELDIKVSDFGAAQLARADVTQVSGVGSPAYMSPEQIQGEEVDWRTDMYSLGAVLYHMLTGRRPFDGANAYQLVEAILGSSPPPPSRARPDIPAGLDEVVARAMAKSRAGRFASWQEFASSIAQRLSLDGGAELSDAEKFAAARRLRFFDRFNDADLWQVVRASTWRNHAAGSALIREGAADEHFFVLASGMLKVTQRGKLLNVVSPGECVGEMAYARRDGQPRSATVTAVEPSWAMALRVQEVDALPEGCRGRFNEAFLAIMAERLAMLSGRLVSQDAKAVV
ncbi:MAG TPA: serine/threonine-protein kinase [Burkholderiales bacterium]|jgi:serine/threonine protein kinase|nr:serine/threonine-protein kinase [Burkholderiales bacterium]